MKKYIVAHNYMCFLALVEMIIYETYDYTVISQFDMAELFGLTIPFETSIPIRNFRNSSNQREYGLHINEELLNDMFKTKGIRLRTTYFKENPFEYNEIDEYCASTFVNNKHLIYTFGYGYLFKDIEKLDLGHAVLFEATVSDSLIKVYDPGPLNPGIKVINRVDLHEAMLKRGGGIYVFDSI